MDFQICSPLECIRSSMDAPVSPTTYSKAILIYILISFMNKTIDFRLEARTNINIRQHDDDRLWEVDASITGCKHLS